MALLIPALLVTPGASAGESSSAPDAGAALAVTSAEADTGSGGDFNSRPYLGWSSWSLQATQYPGVNPQGRFSWLNEENLLAQIDVLAEDLSQHGYEYVNIDAGWWMDWDWNPGYDRFARQTTDLDRFPSGMEYIADYVHDRGLKLGVYLPVGLEMGAYNNGESPIHGAPGCTTADIVYDDLRPTNGFGETGSAYAMDFSDPCSQRYLESLVDMFDEWDVDLLKLDGVGPGSRRDPAVDGENYNNIPDVAAWHEALRGEDIHLLVSWAMDRDYLADWQAYTDSWRVGGDVECYCETMTSWRASNQSIRATGNWIGAAGPETGWNNLDSLNVGVGEMDGLTEEERRTVFTFWALAASPLYLGDDLTRLDDFGRSLITNDEVIGINQLGIPAQRVGEASPIQVWYLERPDGSLVVGLFNLSEAAADVAVSWDELGLSGSAQLRDVWADEDLGAHEDGFSANIGAHGSQLITVTPSGR
ncbi:glycoside hydrolase family 27 protein [Streptomyces sp. B6B3]|uniref:glycoside hydrolase family 27 protein n=1 Tax=Streptomyces sp. B6B3 TaxID=3153570 RepID=UPI00325CA068